MMKAAFAACSLALMLGGCFETVSDLTIGPKLSPMGSGLTQDHAKIENMQATPVAYTSHSSLWQDAGADLFKDARAGRVGDVVTVRISIKDQASLNNTTNTKREAIREMNVTNTMNLQYSPGNTNVTSTGQLDPKIDSTTQSQGQGQVQRSESIDLLIGAVVTSVLPNGNLVVSGRQEVLVNREIRELLVTGIIRPRDVATDNSISYDKIAEARISYGGRGNVMEMQQPGWGQQLFDKISPF
jgi:flagellar L-ring protein precursor FlgH